MSSWRLRLDPAASGERNMAMDEALFARARHGVATLRLYSWDGPWLSIGYGQPLAPDRWSRCRRAGVGVVQRVTGGRAVLHGGDLTYSIAAPLSALPDGLEASYRLVTDALLEALRRLGLPAQRALRSQRDTQARFDCFARSAAEEIEANHRKLVGSAQRRNREALLQHGSLRVFPDPHEAVRAAGLEGRATSLAELGYRGDEARLCEAVVAALGRALGARFEPDGVRDPPFLDGLQRQPRSQEPS